MPIVDAMKGKAIRINHIPTGALSKCKEFSLDATKIFKALHYWADGPVTTILQSPTARVFSLPSISQMPVVFNHSVMHGLGFFVC